jgi:hypothetical protein
VSEGKNITVENVRKGCLIFSSPDLGENCFLVTDVSSETVWRKKVRGKDVFRKEYTFSGIWLTQHPPQRFFGTVLYFTEKGSFEGWTLKSF